MTLPPLCERCHNPLPAGNRFCPSCGLALSEPEPGDGSAFWNAGASVTEQQATPDTYNVVCPNLKCQALNSVFYEKATSHKEVICFRCHTNSVVRMYKIRTGTSRKATRGSKFSIRVKDFNGAESLVEFIHYGTGHVEFKAGDTVAFVSLNGPIKVFQNFTVNKWTYVGETFQQGGCCGCGGATAVMATMLLVGFISSFHTHTTKLPTLPSVTPIITRIVRKLAILSDPREAAMNVHQQASRGIH